MFVPAYAENELRAAVASATSMSEVLRRFGLRPAGGNHRQLRRWLDAWQISTDHFAQGWHGPRAERTPLDKILVAGSTYHRGHLKRRLYEEGLKERRCELCGQGEEWRGKRMALILDHINGVADDNRLENLQIVCPNCAATLDTHCGRQNRRPEVRRTCPHCGKEFVATDPRRRYCSRYCGRRWDRHAVPRPGARRVERPPYEALLEEIAATNWSAVGRRYGVSDNAVRKWVRAYEAERRGAASGG
jgi:transposase-like protein